MADSPRPTYRVTHDGDVATYTCLVPDAGKPEGHCGHQATDLDLFTQHMQQQHMGTMEVEATPEQHRPAATPASRATRATATSDKPEAGAQPMPPPAKE